MRRIGTRWFALTVLATLASLILPACSVAPPKPGSSQLGDYEYVKRYGDWMIRKVMKKNDVQGLSIALVDGNRLVWAEGFGFADKASRIPSGADTIYRVGSISKLFTVTAAMQLVEQGKIGLDRPLADYVPDFAIRSRFPETQPVTIRSLMTHHSGLPSDYLKGMWTKDPSPIAELPTLLRGEYAAFPPNTVFSYSNLGMTLLGLAIQNTSGQPFDTHIRESVLLPLGMANSSFAPGIARSPLAARAYKGRDEVEEPALRDVPAGGLNSSAADISRFIRMVLAEGEFEGRRVLTAESVREMLRPQNLHVPLDLSFRTGLGWALGGLGRIDMRNAGPVAHHAGATIYHRAQLIVLPEAKLGVVVLANGATDQNVVSAVASKVLTLALEAKKGIRQPDPKPIETGPFLSAADLASYEGSYATVAGPASVRADGDHLSATVMNRTFRLVPRSDRKLQLQYRLWGLFPIDLGELSLYGLERKRVGGTEILGASFGNTEMLVGEKIAPAMIPGSWRRRVGRYEYTNAGKDIRLFDKVSLREKDGLLLIEYTLPAFGKAAMTAILEPVSDDAAVFAGHWRGMGETVTVVPAPDGERLRYSGYEMKRVANH